MNRLFLPLAAFCGLFFTGNLAAADPDPEVKTMLPGVKLTMVAEHPKLATPTGIDVDGDGKVWLISCHTHMPPDDYAGPKLDEVLIFDREGNRRVFYNATHHTMDLELGPDGWVYLAERDRIFRIRDSDGDGKADLEENLAVLETEADYPHNALSGLAWHPDGDLFFALGENFAKPWTLTDPKGKAITGIGEGGVFRCRPDGTQLRRIAQGMWNPFGLCVRSDGEIFVSDNDPGERPPCRLLHIVEGGDYGYQRMYGGEAHHPFVGWNGELLGTLPMVHPTGEAPCGVVALGRGLLIPSWSDHRIDFFALKPKGASFSADRIALVQGTRYFRPTCIAEDESAANSETRTWYLTDWVDGRYQVHGYGRLWRLEINLKEAGKWLGPLELESANESATLAAEIRSGKMDDESDNLRQLAEDKDPFIARAAVVRISEQAASWKPSQFNQLSDNDRANTVVALKIANPPAAPWIKPLLADPNPEVQFETLRWISDAQLTEFLPEVEAALERSDLTFEVFEAAMAAWNTLSGTPDLGVRNPEKLLAKVQDEASPPRLRAFALRLIPTKANAPAKSGPDAQLRFPKGLTIELLNQLLAVGDPQLSLEVVRVLAGNPAVGQKTLATVAVDADQPAELRAEAVAGLAAVAPDYLDLLVSMTGAEKTVIREEALRILRNRPLDEGQQTTIQKNAERFPASADLFAALKDPTALVQGRPSLTDTEGWIQRLDAVPGDANVDSGERIFHHASIALCARCHRHSGRGNVVGPDLSSVSKRQDRNWLLRSILEPGLEIAPEYLSRTVTLKDGTTATGIRLRSWTREQLRDANGFTLTFDRGDVASIEELATSFMPAGLVYSLTDRELRDLLAFLESQELAP